MRPFAFGLNRHRRASIVSSSEPAAHPTRDVGDLVAWFGQLELPDGQPFEPPAHLRPFLQAAFDGELPTLSEHLIAARRAGKRERQVEAIARALLAGERVAVSGRDDDAQELLLAGAQRANLYALALGLDVPDDVEQLLTMTPGNRKDPNA